jgi:hypothetical protein
MNKSKIFLELVDIYPKNHECLDDLNYLDSNDVSKYVKNHVYINDVFELSNPNPYLHPTKSINLNEFNHTDFNITLNNVSSSVTSVSRQKIEKLYTIDNQKVLSNNSEYSSSAELQESNLSLQGFNNSRYDGTKIYSLKYNEYTTSSLNYEGDKSFGKTSVIDYNTNKLGLFTSINEDVFFKTKKIFFKFNLGLLNNHQFPYYAYKQYKIMLKLL